jgi:predicted DNA-binding transcriptional regulator YafY
LERKTIRFQYHARFGDEKNALTARTVNPYSIANINTVWYLNGYDHARRALRHYRLDRVEAVEISTKTFARPQNYRVERSEGPRPLTIRALFDPESNIVLSA